jgi:NADH-quinone oxidoreductase subunit G
MTQPAQPDLIAVNIDGREIAVPPGTNMIEAARLLGIDIPHFCYHSKLSVAGNCRMCLVEMGKPAVDPATREPIPDPATGRQQIRWASKPVIACFTVAAPGLYIRTNTPLIKECREGVMEFLLINHPLDCPICDQAGECKLQEQATQYGRGYSRFVERKNVKPKRTLLGPRVMLDDERCILCSRCVRFSKEIAHDDVLGFTDRGSYSTLTCYPGKRLENNYSLNTVDICPVGALTSVDFRFKMRVWFLKQTNSIDPESSVGVNTVVWSREGVIYRITPRGNDEVNDTWMADSGRLLYQQVRAANRLLEPRVNGQSVALAAALSAAAGLLQIRSGVSDMGETPMPPATAGQRGTGVSPVSANRKSELENRKSALAVVGSGRSSVEEQFLTKRLAAVLKAPAWIVARVGEGDRLLVSADRNPNTRGALVTGLIRTLPSPTLTELAAQIDAGQVKTVVSVGEDLAAAGLTAAQLAKISVIYLGTHANATADAAKVVLPTLTVFEKSGTFVNQQFRLQKFAAAVPGPAGASDDLAVLSQLLAAVGGPPLGATVAALWPALAAEIPQFGGVTYQSLPDTGRLLDRTPWAALPFAEGETLHYQPAGTSADRR